MEFKKTCHKELKDGEIWVGNTDVRKGLKIPSRLATMKTVRLGEIAYDIHGNKIDQNYCRPLIIHKSEENLYNKIMLDALK